MSNRQYTISRRFSGAVLSVMTGIWIVGIIAGFLMLTVYENSASQVYDHPQALPEMFRSADGRDVLIMALHPHCPCSRASLSELQKLQVTIGDGAEIFILVYVPDAESTSWAEGLSLSQTERLNAEVMYDPGGRLCSTLGLNTSGETLIYSREASLLFAGGITASRGHAGSNYGIEFIKAAVRGEKATKAETPVFGCSIRKVETGDILNE